MEGADSPKAIGKRLKALREVKKLSQDRIALIVGMASKSSAWNRYEKGTVALPAHHGLALCRIYGVTMDWIYRGLWTAGMPYELTEDIQALEGAAPPSANRRRP